ncbi:MAG: phage scaffold protein [Firmicutes bacterium]|nr:phage scaffold protein [Bacillota bacterium]
MAEEFKPILINTQDEMDNLFKERLTRERQKYDGYMSPKDVEELKAGYDKQIADLNKAAASEKEKYAAYDAQIKERDAKIAKYEADSAKTRIAIAAGLDPKYASRLVGKDEKEWKADAEELAKDFRSAHVPPLANPEGHPVKDSKKAALKGMLQTINGGN